MASKSFGLKAPKIAHLVRGAGGLSGEIADLRSDVEEAFVTNETPGLGGTGLIAVDEWTNVLAASANYVMASTNAAVAAVTVTTFSHATIPHARNLTVGCTIIGVGESNVVVTGTDINGDAISETFAVPSGNGTVTGVKAFKTVNRVVIPALTAGMTGLAVVVGVGNVLGLSSKIKVRNSIPNVLTELFNGMAVVGDPIRLTGHASFLNPKAAELVSVVGDVLLANGAQIIAAQPDYPRKLQVRITDADSSISAGTITLVGVGIDGTAVTQVIPLAGGTRTVITDAVYATLTSATVAALAGHGVGDNVGIGVGAALGLPIPAGAGSVSVTKTVVDSAGETVAGVDATARSVAPTTAANAARDYDFYFAYTVTPGRNAQSYAGTAGTFTTPAVSAPHGTFAPGVVPDATNDYVLVYERDLS